MPALVRRAHRRVVEHVRLAERLPSGVERDVQWREARKAAKLKRPNVTPPV